MKLFLTIFTISVALSACASESEYDPNWGTDNLVIRDQKADVIDLAPAMDFDQTVKGSVDETELDLYKIELTAGDRITFTKTVTRGDLRPDISLFTRSGASVRSKSFEVSTDKLIKNYDIHASGDYLVVVRAFRHDGSGRYEAVATCNGGPCAGEFPDIDPNDFHITEAIECIGLARECALNELPRFNGAVGESRAQSIMNGCLENNGSGAGNSCKTACDFDADASQLCDDIVATLPFYADQSEACGETLNSCMDDCIESEDYTPDEIWSSQLAICWINGFNGSCNTYARNMPECGGDVQSETGECYENCLVTPGAFIDDMDVICEEWCGECGIECLRERFGFDEVHQRDSGIQGDAIRTVERDIPNLGAVCVTFIHVMADGDGELPVGVYGVVEESPFRCLGDIANGSGIAIEMPALSEITDPTDLGLLHDIDQADGFFMWNGVDVDFDMN